MLCIYRIDERDLCINLYIDEQRATPFYYFCQTEYYNDDYIRGDMKLLLYFSVEGGIINKSFFFDLFYCFACSQ